MSEQATVKCVICGVEVDRDDAFICYWHDMNMPLGSTILTGLKILFRACSMEHYALGVQRLKERSNDALWGGVFGRETMAASPSRKWEQAAPAREDEEGDSDG